VALASDVDASRAALRISAAQDAEIARNAALWSAPTMPALHRYTGVLHDALDLGSLRGAAAARARSRLAVTSALFGLLRADDPVPAYRLSAGSALPGRGTLAASWRPLLEPVLAAIAAAELVVDLVERAVPGTDRRTTLDAKRYRSAEHRLFHRDAGYLEGRRVRRSREMRAMAHRTDFGRDILSGQWAGAEFAALSRLWTSGVAVPYPVRVSGTELLLEFVGSDDGTAAPRLAQLRPDADRLCDLWHQLVDALLGLARHGLAHGDLSAYNVLVHDGKLVLIGLPQAVDVVGNPQGPEFLARDMRRIGERFTARGLPPEVGIPESLLDAPHVELGNATGHGNVTEVGANGFTVGPGRLDHERPAHRAERGRTRSTHSGRITIAPGLVSEIPAAAISALLLRATCHVPEVRLTSPSSRRAQFSAPRPRRSDGGRPSPARSRPRGAGSISAPVIPEVLWTVPESGMPSFAELGLPEPVVRALDAEGFTEPFPIQAATLPDAIAGRDLLGRGQTGSGKTLAFGLALLSRLAGAKAKARTPRGLVLVPTRELATQVVDALTPFAKALGLTTTSVVGGMSFNRQAAELSRGIDLLVATPGRLTDHTTQRTCDLSQVTITAIDEADRMADMGFLPQVRKILDLTPVDGQRLLFSATLDGDVGALVRQYLTDPVSQSVNSATAQVETMDHHVLHVDLSAKPRIITEIAARDGRTLLFVRTKHGVDRLVKTLRRDGINAGALHGGKAQNARNRAIADFKDGQTPVLVATDVAARGIHIDDVSLVVHVDPPADPKDYLHRAGRTARAGDSGTVVTMVTPPERRDVDRLTRLAGVRATNTDVRPGDDALARITGARTPSGVPIIDPPKPAQSPSRGGGRRARSGSSTRLGAPSAGRGGDRSGSRGRRRDTAA